MREPWAAMCAGLWMSMLAPRVTRHNERQRALWDLLCRLQLLRLSCVSGIRDFEMCARLYVYRTRQR